MKDSWKDRIDGIIVKEKKYRIPDFRARELAEMLGISTFQLARILKKEYSMSYSDIILPLRIKEAKKHLLNPKKANLTVEEIGILVGFNNKWSFFQAFRKYTGMTPNEWRKERVK